MIHIIRKKATSKEVKEMLEELGTYIKLAVDIKRGIIAGGCVLHADCEALLMEDGSKQEDIWGADWLPDTEQVKTEALINIRPKQGNRTMSIEDEKMRVQVENISAQLLTSEK
jgi:hypothetical protein